MGNDYKVIGMQKKHIKMIALLEEQCFSDPWSGKALEEELYNPCAVYYIAQSAEPGEEIAGYIGMHNAAGDGYITNVAVFEKWRKKGVASSLLVKVTEYAENNAMNFLSLEVRKSNFPAINLYSKAGFMVEGYRKDFYNNPKEDALIMTRYFTERQKEYNRIKNQLT